MHDFSLVWNVALPLVIALGAASMKGRQHSGEY
jgi:hypothetical protein